MTVAAVLIATFAAPSIVGTANAETVGQTLIAFNSQWHSGIASGPDRPTITIKPGDTVQLRIENHDRLFHTFSFPRFAIEEDLDNGTSSSPTIITVTITTSSADNGKWQFFCRPHSSGADENRQGMMGWLEVKPNTPGFEAWAAVGAVVAAFLVVAAVRRRK